MRAHVRARGSVPLVSFPPIKKVKIWEKSHPHFGLENHSILWKWSNLASLRESGWSALFVRECGDVATYRAPGGESRCILGVMRRIQRLIKLHYRDIKYCQQSE